MPIYAIKIIFVKKSVLRNKLDGFTPKKIIIWLFFTHSNYTEKLNKRGEHII